jgi:hypothetical protein
VGQYKDKKSSDELVDKFDYKSPKRYQDAFEACLGA